MSARDHWPLHARQWALVGPPLRPSAEDVAFVEAEVAAWSAARGRPPRALLLGVTPELATMAWPAGTSLVAVDRSDPMIGAVFPPHAGEVMRADWRALPRPAGSIDVVVGDGCLTCLSYPADHRAIAAELRRVLAADGRLVLRLFVAPDPAESLADVAAALAAGRIHSFHALKWRLAMAVQPPSRNVRVVEILRAFEMIAPDRAALTRRTGWAPEVVATIDVYRDSDLVYAFPTAAEARAALADDFVEIACAAPRYELGDRCPTLVLRPRTR